jgi:hypothetical protein
MLPAIIAPKSIFDFDSTPPVASVRPSGLKAIDVTLRPIVPADIEPIMFVIIAEMSAMLGIAGIEPGLPAPFIIARGSIIPGLIVPGLAGPVIDPRLASGEDFNSRSRLPDAVSQSETWPIEPRVASIRPSELNPASNELESSVNERNSRPDFTSQIFSWVWRSARVGFFCWMAPGPYEIIIMVLSALKLARWITLPPAAGASR